MRLHLALPLLCLTVFTVAAATAHADDYYLQVGHTSQQTPLPHWELVGEHHGWHLETSGGPRLDVFEPEGNYHNNGVTLFTPDTQDAFEGKTLNLARGRLEMRFYDDQLNSSIGAVVVAPQGSAMQSGSYNDPVGIGGLAVKTLTLNGDLGLGTEGAGFRKMRLMVDSLAGTGNIVTAGDGNLAYFGAANASTYTGNILHTVGKLDFENDLVSGGGLVITAGATVMLDQDVTFTALTINGEPLAPGKHTFSDLDASYGEVFDDAGSGSITVAKP